MKLQINMDVDDEFTSVQYLEGGQYFIDRYGILCEKKRNLEYVEVLRRIYRVEQYQPMVKKTIDKFTLHYDNGNVTVDYDKKEPLELCFRDVKNGQLFIDNNGNLCQKVNGMVYTIIVQADGTVNPLKSFGYPKDISNIKRIIKQKDIVLG